MSIDPKVVDGVCRVLAAEVGVNPSATTLAMKLTDAPEWNSLGFMRVLVALEEEFKVVVEVEDLVAVVTVDDLCQIIAQRMTAGKK